MTGLGVALELNNKKMGIKLTLLTIKYILDAFWGFGLLMTATYTFLLDIISDSKIKDYMQMYHPSQSVMNILIAISIAGAVINLTRWVIKALSDIEDYQEKKRTNKRNRGKS